MDCLIISGVSGGGKSLVVDALEDTGYYCVDNMPAALIPRFAELFMDSSAKYQNVAFVVDVRGGSDFSGLFKTLEEMRNEGVACRILFLDCSDDCIVNRHKTTRRRHPLDNEGKGIYAAISEERAVLEGVRDAADFVIDTTDMLGLELQSKIKNMFCETGSGHSMITSILTFGAKYGLPREADLVFDVRFLKNPYYVPELRDRTGLEDIVYDYVFSDPAAEMFLLKLLDMLEFLIPYYIKEGKNTLVVAIGCTGGKQRSVSMGRRLKTELEQLGHSIVLRHRDCGKV